MNTSLPSTGLISELRQIPRPFYVLVTGTLINRFGHFVIPFLAIYLGQLGFEASVTGVTLAAYGAGGILAAILGGYLADKVGRKPTLLVSCAGATAAMLLLSQARSAELLVLGSFLCGLMSAIYYPASSALIADIVPKSLLTRAYSVQRLAINLGFAAGMATAGLVAKGSFATLFIMDAGTTAAMGLLVLFGLPSGIGKRANQKSASMAAALSHIGRNKAFMYAAAASMLSAALFWQTSSTFGLQVIDLAGLDERAFGMLLALNGVMIVTMELGLTSWSRRFDPQKSMALGFALVGLGLGINALGANLPILVLSIVILTIGEMIALPIASSYVAKLAPEDMRGRYMGAFGLTWNMAMMLGPLIGLSVFAHSPNGLWIGCVLVGLLSAWLIVKKVS